MHAPPRVRLTNPSEDRFPLRSALFVFVGCALLGVLGARQWIPAKVAAPSEPPATRPPVVAVAAPVRPIPEPSAPEPSAPEPIAPTPAPASVQHTRIFEQGQVAYLRCDGVEQADARFPCPRDRTFEDAVWAVLRTLPECPAAELGRGRAEARLSWTLGGPTEVLIKADDDAGTLRGAVSKCAGDRLSALRSSMRTTRGIAAFRFELR